MALDNAFNRIKREVGIKRCMIIDGNVGDVYLNEKGQVVDLKTYLKQILAGMEYDNVICWDKIDGTKDDIGSLELVEEVEVVSPAAAQSAVTGADVQWVAAVGDLQQVGHAGLVHVAIESDTQFTGVAYLPSVVDAW